MQYVKRTQIAVVLEKMRIISEASREAAISSSTSTKEVEETLAEASRIECNRYIVQTSVNRPADVLRGHASCNYRPAYLNFRRAFRSYYSPPSCLS